MGLRPMPRDRFAAAPALIGLRPNSASLARSRGSPLSFRDGRLSAIVVHAEAPHARPGAYVDVAERIAQLGKVPLFAGLTPVALELISRVATEESHALGTKIFQHGDPGDKLYIIMDGKVRISRDVPGMGEEALAVLGPGAVFGEMALLDEAPRSADARVHERCRLLALPKDAFEDLLFLHKDLAYEVLWSVVRMLTGRLRETNDKLTFLSVTGKFE
jgi:hypothetical protein